MSRSVRRMTSALILPSSHEDRVAARSASNNSRRQQFQQRVEECLPDGPFLETFEDREELQPDQDEEQRVQQEDLGLPEGVALQVRLRG